MPAQLIAPVPNHTQEVSEKTLRATWRSNSCAWWKMPPSSRRAPWGKAIHTERSGGTEAMRKTMDTVPMHGTIVIGEGERDEAPMPLMRMPLSRAFSISYSVRQAIVTAVSASISTPVWPSRLAYRLLRAPRSAPGRSSKSTACFCQRNRMTERDQVDASRFAAMMPAIRAVAITSPLGAAPASISARFRAPSRYSLRRRRYAASTASRHVDHRRFALRIDMVRSAHGRSFSSSIIGGKKRACRDFYIRLPHQALADEKGCSAESHQAGDIGRCKNPAFRDH